MLSRSTKLPYAGVSVSNLKSEALSPVSFSVRLHLRYPSLSRQQFRRSPRRQPAPLAQVPAGANRDGRSCQLSGAHSPASPQRPSGRPPPPPPQSSQRLGSLLAPSHSQPHRSVPLPSTRLPDRLQTPRTARHRATTECRRGSPLNTDWSRQPTLPHLTLYPLILYPAPLFPNAIHTNLQSMKN